MSLCSMNAGEAFTERYLNMMFASLRDATPEQIQVELEHCRKINRKPVRVPRYFKDHFVETAFEAQNGFPMQVFSTKPYPGNDNVILYFHGGACIYQPVFFHWRFIHDLAIRTHYQVVMPIYPKYPEYHCVDDMVVLLDFYERYMMQLDVKRMVLMGDSFGGNLALSMTQEIARREWRHVDDLVVLSPCVDNTFEHRDRMVTLQPLDRMIELERIEIIMGGWRGELPARHPWASPLFGDLTSFPDHTMIIYGSDEILKCDAELLTEAVRAIGRPIIAQEYPGMFHTFPMFPVKEGFRAVKEITKLVLS